jgi:alanyl-tRNA synthetase
VFVHETGVAAGVRRVEALTARGAFAHFRARENLLHESAELLKSPVDTLPKKVQSLLDERRVLEKRVADALKGGGGGLADVIGKALTIHGVKVASGELTGVPDMKSLLTLGDAIREQIGSGIGVLAARFDDGKSAMVATVTDDIRSRGVAADAIVKELAVIGGGRGGGKPQMAQAGLPNSEAVALVLGAVEQVVTGLLAV